MALSMLEQIALRFETYASDSEAMIEGHRARMHNKGAKSMYQARAEWWREAAKELRQAGALNREAFLETIREMIYSESNQVKAINDAMAEAILAEFITPAPTPRDFVPRLEGQTKHHKALDTLTGRVSGTLEQTMSVIRDELFRKDDIDGEDEGPFGTDGPESRYYTRFHDGPHLDATIDRTIARIAARLTSCEPIPAPTSERSEEIDSSVSKYIESCSLWFEIDQHTGGHVRRLALVIPELENPLEMVTINSAIYEPKMIEQSHPLAGCKHVWHKLSATMRQCEVCGVMDSEPG